MSKSLSDDAAIYAIGAAAQLAGLSPSTVRTWERRYQAVTPSRTRGGGRRYTDADVERLQLLRVLTANGGAISEVAALDTPELRQRASRLTGSSASVARPLNAVVLHPTLATRLSAHPTSWKVVARLEALPRLDGGLEAIVSSDTPPDVLFVSLDALGEEPDGALERCRETLGNADVVVLYHFAPRRVLGDLANAGARLAREPVDVTELHRLVREQAAVGMALVTSPPPDVVPPFSKREFDDATLARLREVATKLECECPNHIATIVSSLVAFEAYSQRCEYDSPADMELHHELYRETARARSRMEKLLRTVCAHDGIPI